MVADGPPVATSFACTPFSRVRTLALSCEDDPVVEYAIVLPLASFRLLIGDCALTYQNTSAPPLTTAPITRTGAPLEKALSTPMIPAPTPMSTLPEMTACCVSPPPGVWEG